MDLATKTRISDRIKLRLSSAMAAFPACEPMAQVVTHDTDIAALQSLLGDHFTFQCSGVVRISDWLRMHPEDGENT